MPVTIDFLSLIIGIILGVVIGIFLIRQRYKEQISGVRKIETETQLVFLEKERDALRTAELELKEQVEGLLHEKTKLSTTLEYERKAGVEKLEVVEQAKDQMTNMFKAISQDALNANRDTFLSLAKEKLKEAQVQSKTDMDKKETAIKDIIDPVSKSLEKMDQKIADLEKTRHGAYGEMREYLQTMKDSQEKLRSETASLVQALRSPSTRGQWGELQLKRTLEMAGLVEGVHYEQQVSVDTEDGRQRPDVIVKLPGGQIIVIDAKAPLEAYLDSLGDGIEEIERGRQLDRHARHVRDHMKMLGSKAYWQQFNTPEFVVMFLPGESYFSAALERDPSLLEAGVDSRVIPSSPTTLIALLKAVSYGWKQQKLTESAQEISSLGKDMYNRLATFGDHMNKVGKGLNSAVDNYNNAVGSLERSVLPIARKFEELQVSDGKKSVTGMDTVDKTPRALTADELLEGSPADIKKIEKKPTKDTKKTKAI